MGVEIIRIKAVLSYTGLELELSLATLKTSLDMSATLFIVRLNTRKIRQQMEESYLYWNA